MKRLLALGLAVICLAWVILPHASWLRGRFSLQPRRSVSTILAITLSPLMVVFPLLLCSTCHGVSKIGQGLSA